MRFTCKQFLKKSFYRRRADRNRYSEYISDETCDERILRYVYIILYNYTWFRFIWRTTPFSVDFGCVHDRFKVFLHCFAIVLRAHLYKYVHNIYIFNSTAIARQSQIVLELFVRRLVELEFRPCGDGGILVKVPR